MKFLISGKEYELKFGLKFIRELDKVYTVDYQGMRFGMGLNLAYMGLSQYNPTALSNVIRASISHEGIFKESTVDNAVEEYADEHDGLNELFEQAIEEMGKSKVVKDTLEQFKKNAVVNEN